MAKKPIAAPEPPRPEITDEQRREWALDRIIRDHEGWARMFKWYSEKHHYHWAVSLNRERGDILKQMDEFTQYGGDPTTLPPLPEEIEEVLPTTAKIITAEDIDAAIHSRKREHTDDFFKTHQSATDYAKYLKDGAGLGGGGTFYFPDGISGWVNYGSKGLTIVKGNFREGPTKHMTWTAVAHRMAELLLLERMTNSQASDIPVPTPVAMPQTEQPQRVEFKPVPMATKRIPQGQLSFLDLI